MKDKEKIVRLLCEISDLLRTTHEQQSIINLSVTLGLIYGQKVIVDISQSELNFDGITFGERGVGKLVANALSNRKHTSKPVTKN